MMPERVGAHSCWGPRGSPLGWLCRLPLLDTLPSRRCPSSNRRPLRRRTLPSPSVDDAASASQTPWGAFITSESLADEAQLMLVLRLPPSRQLVSTHLCCWRCSHYRLERSAGLISAGSSALPCQCCLGCCAALALAQCPPTCRHCRERASAAPRVGMLQALPEHCRGL